jgi:hypothetical protein
MPKNRSNRGVTRGTGGYRPIDSLIRWRLARADRALAVSAPLKEAGRRQTVARRVKYAAVGNATSGCETLKALRDLVVKERSTDPGTLLQLPRGDPSVALPESATDSGIEVHEEEWGTVTAQHLYKMRCECGRSWFELEVPRFVKCPACSKLGLVSR